MATRNSTGKTAAISKKNTGTSSAVISVGYSGKDRLSFNRFLIPILETGSPVLLTNALTPARVSRLSDWLAGYRYKIKTASTDTKAKPFTLYLTPAGYHAFILNDLIQLRESDRMNDQQEKKERRIKSNLDQLERHVIEMSLRGKADIAAILTSYVAGLEKLITGLKASILRVNEGRVYNWTSPSLPAFYAEALNGLAIGPAEGSCGTAAYTGKQVIVSSIAKSPLWKKYRALATTADLSACWSTPIFNPQGKVIATFANYYSEVRVPSPLELEIFNRASVLISILIESYEKEQQLRLFETVVKTTSDAVLITKSNNAQWDNQEIIYVNEAFTRMTGYIPGEVTGKTPAILEGPKTDMAEISRLRLAMKTGEPCTVNVIHYTKQHKEYRVELVMKPVFDDNGRLSHYFSILRDITLQFKQQQQSRLMEIVSSTFKKHEGLVVSLGSVLKKLVAFGDFTAAETWILGADNAHFSLVASFGATKQARDYYKENRSLNTLTPDGGLLKEVWTSREMVIVDNFDQHPTLRRRAGVEKAGFKSALAIPLLNRGEMVGILTVLTDKTSAHLSEFEQLFKGLESDLGSEIRRKQLENELGIIFNTAPDIIAVVGYDGYFKRINPAASAILGYTTEELLSHPYTTFIHPDHVTPTDAVTASLPAITGSNYFENCYITKSGKTVWLGWTYQQMPDEDLVYTVAKDITRQKELQQLLHDATNLARIGAWEMDLVTLQINWSDVTREIHEVGPDYQPVLDDIYQFYQESDKPILEQSVNKAIKEGIPYDLELLHVTAKGNRRWVRIIGTPEMANGKCVRIYGSFQDIDARKLAEIELKQRTRYLSANATVANIFLSNEDWFDGIRNSFDLARYTVLADQIFYKEVYTDSNTGELMLRQRLGWLKGQDQPVPEDQAPPSMPFSMFPEIHEVLISDQHYSAFISELPDNTLKRVLEQAGIRSVLFLPVFAGTVLEGVVGVEECSYERRWADGEIFFMRSLCSSLSSAIQRSRTNATLKKLNEDLSKQAGELMVSNAELEQFAYVASHDLQEPLRMVTSFLTKLEERYGPMLDERARRYIHFAVDGAGRMRQNILGLLQYSRVGKGDALPEQIDLNEVMEEVCLLHKTDINDSGAEITVDPLPVVHNYLAPIVQLFNNLVSNALKYRKPDVPPRIHISARQEGEFWQIAIQDNGIGIGKEYLQKVFVIFQRLVPKEQYEGTGIGLAVVKKIVENLGGKVWVESTPGVGSTFYFTIRSVFT